MNTKQEQWMDEVMGSLQQMQRPSGNPHLHTRVMAKLRQPLARQPLQIKWVYAFSTVFGLILMVNIFGWKNADANSNDRVNAQTVDIETVINEYDLENNYTSLP